MSQSFGLNYFQKEEVKEIVNNKLVEKDLLKAFDDLFKSLHYENNVRNTVERFVPIIGSKWTENNLKNITESIANNYMRNNFKSFFNQEIKNNKEVNGFISTHLNDVEQKVNITASNAINQIMNSNNQFKPIFDSYLSILSERNKKLFDSQSSLLQSANTNMCRIENENIDMRSKISELEKSVNTLSSIVCISVVGAVCSGLYVVLNK